VDGTFEADPQGRLHCNVHDNYKATLRMDRLIGALLNLLHMGLVETHQEGVDFGMQVKRNPGHCNLPSLGDRLILGLPRELWLHMPFTTQE